MVRTRRKSLSGINVQHLVVVLVLVVLLLLPVLQWGRQGQEHRLRAMTHCCSIQNQETLPSMTMIRIMEEKVARQNWLLNTASSSRNGICLVPLPNIHVSTCTI